MNTFKTTLALVLAAGLNTAAFAQTTPGNTQTPTSTNGTGTMQTTPGTTNGTGTMRNGDGTMRDGTMRDGSMQNSDGTMRTRNSGSRTMKTKANKGKMKDKNVN